MKQVLQNLGTGVTEVAEVPSPAVRRGHVLVRTRRTLVSAGTERMLVEFGKAGWLEKARQQPDKVKMVLEKIRTDGLLQTLDAVRAKLDQPLPMGYCNVGEVIAVGEGVTGFSPGDRVVSNGNHAEVIVVPVNLCARVPAGVSDDDAVFTVLGAIALQGIRLVNPTLGEAVVVTGLGLIGLVTVQLLRANGCRVLGIDSNAQRLQLARDCGAETCDLSAGADPVAAANAFSRGRGIDAVIITASTRSSEPVHQAAQMCRKRGRIVLVGVTGLELSRADFFEKELTFQVSCSYGPGRYDPTYEEKGQDYPLGFVRWTEQRNFEAILDAVDAGHLRLAPLVSHRFAIEDAQRAYEVVGGSEPSLGILLTYSGDATSAEPARARTVQVTPAATGASQSTSISFIGAGNYAGGVLIPAFRESGARLRSVVSAKGVSGVHAARKFGFEQATTDTAAVLADPETAGLVVATRHDTHASYALAAAKAGKHLFLEKPLCLTLDELAQLEAAWSGSPRILMVGFNRRFAPHVQRMKSLLAGTSGPKALTMTVNAGTIPASHWTQDPSVGGGRLIGEGCHFIDLMRFLVGSPIESHEIAAMSSPSPDTFSLTLRFADGSLGTIHYFANGSRALPKERLEVFTSGRVLQLDNFRRLTAFGWPGFKRMRSWRQDKGQRACAAAFVKALQTGGPSPIPLAEITEVTRVSIEAAQALG